MKKATAATLTIAAIGAALWLPPGKSKKTPTAPTTTISAESLAAIAERDSFPTIVIRDTAGRLGPTTATPGTVVQICTLARNRYTGEVRIFIASDAPVTADSVLAVQCEAARQAYAAERGA